MTLLKKIQVEKITSWKYQTSFTR